MNNMKVIDSAVRPNINVITFMLTFIHLADAFI